MTLAELIERLDKFDNDCTIYAEKKPSWTAASRAVVCAESDEEEANAPDGLIYLLEVDIAKEAIEVWTRWSGRKPSIEEKCSAVIYYAENDAYLESF